MSEHPDQPGLEPPVEPPPGPAVARNRLTRRPSKTNGHYMVIAQLAKGAHHGFHELGWYKASGPDQAKRQALADIQNGQVDEDDREWLQAALVPGQPGLILRGVPALNWPQTKPTRYEQGAPKLVLG